MSGSGSFAVSRSHSGDRFYNPPMRRQQQQQQMLLQQQQQLQKQQQQQQLQRATAKADVAAATADVAANRTDSDDSTSTLSKTPSVCSASPPRPPPVNVTNLDRLMESVTPFVPAQHFSEVNVRGRRTREAESTMYYCLGDLWESFSEWSVYGVGVPVLLNGKDSIIQYYVPFLSGIQLYVDPSKPSSRLRRPGEEGDADSSRETSSGGSSDCEVDRRSKSSSDGLWNQHSLVNQNAQRLNRLSLRDKAVTGSSSDEAEISNSLGQLMFEYLEHEQPHHRRPLADKIAALASQFPELKKCRSCDLLPSSWISVAWYPIYRIPVGPTLRDLDASFLTFHSLSTQSRALNAVQPRYHGATGRKVLGNVNACSRISLPVFGLATYKLKGSILSPCGPHESEQENCLLQAADSWLRLLQVILPDYQFFRVHYSPWR
ncbi:uncharacterized protein LOC132047569 [Lycium ferocissimum]|uniref:uncharacterized protein LOC132047569 n=1 Tax=Lycium ferocissimum TaxID=112874 RepID=UPI0028151EFB|nr:uncharacterized protein LOC132047569 [Lycium ferocissimum]